MRGVRILYNANYTDASYYNIDRVLEATFYTFSDLVVYKSPPSITPLAYWEYLFTLRSRIGWIGPGFAFLSGVILDVILIIMVICSMPFIRRKGYFRVRCLDNYNVYNQSIIQSINQSIYKSINQSI